MSIDPVGRGERLQPNDETAALPGLPVGLDRLCLARRPRSFEQPAQIAGAVERGRHEIRVPQLVDAPATEQCDERMIRVGDRAALRAPAQGVWCALELPAPLVLAPFELRLEIRHALGDTAQRFGVGPGGVELPAQPRRSPAEAARSRTPPASSACRSLSWSSASASCASCSATRWRSACALSCLSRSATTVLEPGALRRVLSRDLFECLKRGLQPIERLTNLTIFGGDPLQLRLARQPGAFVGLSLLLDSAVQMLQLILRRAEQALKRLLLPAEAAGFLRPVVAAHGPRRSARR